MMQGKQNASRRIIAPRWLLGRTMLAALVLLSEILILSEELVYGFMRSSDGSRTR
jgi:hypothetical protein